MKVTVEIRRLMGNKVVGGKDAAITLVGFRSRDGEEHELFRWPIDGQITEPLTLSKYYANPEGGVALDEFWVELHTSSNAQFGLKYNISLDHEPAKKATDARPEGPQDELRLEEPAPVFAQPPATEFTPNLQQATQVVSPPPPPAS